jgi:hypothetical protein
MPGNEPNQFPPAMAAEEFLYRLRTMVAFFETDMAQWHWSDHSDQAQLGSTYAREFGGRPHSKAWPRLLQSPSDRDVGASVRREGHCVECTITTRGVLHEDWHSFVAYVRLPRPNVSGGAAEMQWTHQVRRHVVVHVPYSMVGIRICSQEQHSSA